MNWIIFIAATLLNWAFLCFLSAFILRNFLSWKDNKPKPRRVRFDYSVGQPTLKDKHNMLRVNCTNEQKIVVHLNPVTEAGKPTKLDGAPKWSVVSGPGTVNPAADGLSAELISSDTDLGDTIYSVDGDADLGNGVEDVADTVVLTVTHANARALGLTADAPVLK